MVSYHLILRILQNQSDVTGGMCFLMYTSGAEEKLGCVMRTACEDPYLASDYLTAAKMWYKMHKLMQSYRDTRAYILEQS